MLLFLVVYLTHIATLAVCCLTIGLLSLGDALREKVLSPVRQPVALVPHNCLPILLLALLLVAPETAGTAAACRPIPTIRRSSS